MDIIKKILEMAKAGGQTIVPATTKVIGGSMQAVSDIPTLYNGTPQQKQQIMQQRGDMYNPVNIKKDHDAATLELLSMLIPASGSLKTRLAINAMPGVARASSEGADLKTGAGMALMSSLLGTGGEYAARGAGKLIGGAADNLSGVGEALRRDVSKVYTKSSVYGAEKEKAIMETLKKLGIKGAPQQQYEQLQPAMQSLGEKIATSLKNNPQAVTVKDVVDGFFKNMKGALRTKDIEATGAQNEALGYIKDLMKDSYPDSTSLVSKNGDSIVPGGIKVPDINETTKITSDRLFNLKKLINEDLQGVYKKIQNNNPLNAREKVILASRDAIDEIITKLHPDVKDMTRMQSHLYDAAASLGSSRKTVPTTRVMGTTIPAAPFQWAEDRLGNVLEDAGNIANKTKGMGDKTAKLMELLGLGVSGGLSGQKQTNGSYNKNNGVGDNQEGYDVGSQGDHTSTVSQNGTQNQDVIAPDTEITLLDGTKTTYGSLEKQGTFNNPAQESASPISNEQFQQLVVADLMQTGGKNLDKLKTMQELLDPKSKDKPLSATTENRVQLANSGLRALSEVESLIKNDPNKVLKSQIPGQLGARDYDSAAFRAVEGLLRARSGAAVPPQETRNYMKANLPRVGDSEKEIQFKLKAFRRDLEDVAKSGGTAIDQTLLNLLQ